MSLKDTKIIDLNLFSGSSELLRQSVGGNYYFSDSQQLEFEAPSITSLIQIETTEISDASVDNQEQIIPKIKYSTRLISNDSDNIVSDEEWKLLMIGGEYFNKKYDGIYNANVYFDHYNTSPLPLLSREVVNTSELPSLTLTTEYFNYYARYQSEVNNSDSILQIPNFYLLDSSSYLVPQYQTEIVQSRFQYTDLKIFLTSSFVDSTKLANPEMKNIFVLSPSSLSEKNGLRQDTVDLLQHGSFDDDLSKLYSLMPFGNKIDIESDLLQGDGRRFKNIIENNSYQLKLVKLLKEIFQNESGLQTNQTNFAVNTVADISSGTETSLVNSTSTLSIKMVDALSMLTYAYRNPTSETNDITLITGSVDYSSEEDYAFDEIGTYRYENTSASLTTFNDFVKDIETNFSGEPKTYPLENFLSEANEPKYHETLAFRVEKIGGTPTGDSNTQNTLQNIWFYNDGGAFTYLDTQVKYDTEYTYKLYKYDIVEGYKYKLSDLATTRQLAVTSHADNDVYCLEFYDPFTGAATANLLEQDSISPLLASIQTLNEKLNVLRGWADEVLSNSLEYQTLIDKLTTHVLELTSGGLAYENTTLYSDEIRAIRINFPDFYNFFWTRGTNWLPYVKSTTLLSTEEFSDLDNFEYQYVDQYGLSAVERAFSSLPALRENAQEMVYFSQIHTATDTVNTINLLIRERQTLDDLRSIELADLINDVTNQISDLERFGESLVSPLTSSAQVNSSHKYLADFKITIEPSLKILEIPLDTKQMKIVDHPPNNFVITPHHLLDQSNRLAFYCKYDTFSMNAVTYPPTLTVNDEQNKNAYLTGHDFISISELTQESVSRARFIEVYRTITKPTSYSDFTGNLRKSIDLRQTNGDILTDHLFIERVQENVKYYYVFRAVNENGVAGQMSPVFEAELINDGGYVYGKFEQYSEEDLAVPPPKEPLIGFKKLFNIIPNIQHLQLDTSAVNFASSSVSQMSQVALGTSADDDLWDQSKYYKIRLTSKKTGKKIDLNIGFKKEERN